MAETLPGIITIKEEYNEPLEFEDHLQSVCSETMGSDEASPHYLALQLHAYTSDYDDTDLEVARATRRRRRKRGHGWSRSKSKCRRSPSRARSNISDVSRTTFASGRTYLTGYTTDYDSEGLLMEHGVRTDEEVSNVSNVRRKRRRKRGHNWSRSKSRSRSRSVSRCTNQSRATRRTDTSRASRANTRAIKLLAETRTAGVRLKNMFGDILGVKGNLRDFTTAYLIREKDCFEFYASEEENSNAPIIKTRYACKMRNEVLQAYKYAVYECEECFECFLTADLMTEHMINAHNHPALYMCTECIMRFTSWELYEAHKERHDRLFVGNCLFCSQEFTHRKTYEAHMDLYLTCSYKCMYCGNIYLTKYAYKSHVKKRHPGLKFQLKEPSSCIISRVDYDKPEINRYQYTHTPVRILIQKSIIEEAIPSPPL